MNEWWQQRVRMDALKTSTQQKKDFRISRRQVESEYLVGYQSELCQVYFNLSE